MSGTRTQLTPRQREKLKRTLVHCFAEAELYRDRARAVLEQMFPLGSRVVWHDESIARQREGTVVAIAMPHFCYFRLTVRPDDASRPVEIGWNLAQPATGGGR